MKLTIHRDNLMPSLSLLAGVPQKRPVIPVYGMFRFSASDNKLTISANNMEIAATSSAPCETETPGEILIPAGRITDFISSCDTELAFSVASERLMIRAGRSRIEVPVLDPSGFPRMEFHDPTVKFTIPAATLQAAIKPPMLSVDWDNKNFPALSGVLVHGTSEHIDLIGTDSKRLSRVRILTDAQEFKTILPHGICMILSKLGSGSDDIEVAITDRIACFQSTGCEFLTKLIDGDYPDYQRLITERTKNPITFSGQAMLQSLLRCAPIIDADQSQMRGVKLTVSDGKISIYGGIPSATEFFDEIDGHGGPYDGTFQIAFLRDALLSFGDGDVEIHTDNPNMIRLNAIGAIYDCGIIARMRA